MKSTLCLFFGLFFATAFSLKAQDATTQRLTQLMQDFPVMGLSVAVVKEGKVVHTQALGWKEEGKEPLETTDLFRCLLYTSPSPRDRQKSRMPSSA